MGIRVMDITHTITTATVTPIMDTVTATILATVTAIMVTGDVMLDAIGVGGINGLSFLSLSEHLIQIGHHSYCSTARSLRRPGSAPPLLASWLVSIAGALPAKALDAGLSNIPEYIPGEEDQIAENEENKAAV
jgi:hypothetical protein